MTTFSVNADFDATRDEIARQLSTSASELERYQSDLFVVFAKSNNYKDINHIAASILKRPKNSIRGPVFIVKHLNPTFDIFSSCEADDIRRHFDVHEQRANVVAEVKAWKDVSETRVDVEKAPEVVDEVQQVIQQVLDARKEEPDTRIIVLSESDDDADEPGRRGLPIRRHQKRGRKKDIEIDETSLRRSSRIREKRIK